MEEKEDLCVEDSDSLSVPGLDVFLVLGEAFNNEVSIVQGVYFLDEQVHHESTGHKQTFVHKFFDFLPSIVTLLSSCF